MQPDDDSVAFAFPLRAWELGVDQESKMTSPETDELSGQDGRKSGLRLAAPLGAIADASEQAEIDDSGGADCKPWSFGIVSDDDSTDKPLVETQLLENANDAHSRTPGLYARERHYPTLEAMLRLSKVFGYVAIALVFPYLTVRLVYIYWKTETGLLIELARFSEFAIPLLFATVGLVGFLFAASEGIRLAMDLQENTLRIANRGGRRRD